MKIRSLLMAAAAVSLAAAPAVSAAETRASAPVTSESKLGGGDGIIAILAVGVLAAFIALTVINDDEDEDPISA